MSCMQYTIRGIPDYLDMELRAYAQRESKSLNQVLLEMLAAGLGVFRHQPRNAELLALAGTWVEDAATEKALGEMRTVDEEMWK